nr:immunoglobulin heavy chain junction region [Macaca mulatta]
CVRGSSWTAEYFEFW